MGNNERFEIYAIGSLPVGQWIKLFTLKVSCIRYRSSYHSVIKEVKVIKGPEILAVPMRVTSKIDIKEKFKDNYCVSPQRRLPP